MEEEKGPAQKTEGFCYWPELIWIKGNYKKLGKERELLMLNRRLGWQITNLAKRVFLMAPLPGFS